MIFGVFTIEKDSALSWEYASFVIDSLLVFLLVSRQLTASDVNFAIVRPIVFKYAKLDNMATVYACLVVRSHFLAQAEEELAYSGVMLSRANFCEILAMKLLTRFSSDKIRLATVLTASWNPLTGAPEHVLHEIRENSGVNEEELGDPQCALEVGYLFYICLANCDVILDGHCNGSQIFSVYAVGAGRCQRDLHWSSGVFYDCVTSLIDGGQLQAKGNRNLRLPHCALLESLSVRTITPIFNSTP